MGKLKKWATDLLKADPTYTALCTATVGGALNFYRSAPMNRPVEAPPFLTAYSDEAEGDDRGEADWNETWVIPFAIGIETVEASVDDAGVTVWESSDKVEELAMGAHAILKKESAACGILGEDIRVLRYNLAVTEVGEAEYVQANLFITFGKYNSY